MIQNTDMEITNMEAFLYKVNQISKSSFEDSFHYLMSFIKVNI